jgi:cytochrome b561
MQGNTSKALRGQPIFIVHPTGACVRSGNAYTLYCKVQSNHQATTGNTEAKVTAANQRPPLFALLVLVVGLLGLIRDAWPIPLRYSGSLHALFGALLWVCVVARFYRRVNQSPSILPEDIRVIVRELSRLVYLLLYVLMFFCLSIGILRAAPHRPILESAEDFQSYLAYGLFALATIHALAAARQYFAVHGVGAPVGLGQRKGRLT